MDLETVWNERNCECLPIINTVCNWNTISGLSVHITIAVLRNELDRFLAVMGLLHVLLLQHLRVRSHRR